jgi:hypothetical protein
MNFLEQTAKGIALDLREEAVAAADLEEEEGHELAPTADAEPEEGDQAGIESEPAERPSASEKGDGAIASDEDVLEIGQQPPPSDSHLQQQTTEEIGPVSASGASSRRATVPRRSASSGEHSQRSAMEMARHRTQSRAGRVLGLDRRAMETRPMPVTTAATAPCERSLEEERWALS